MKYHDTFATIRALIIFAAVILTAIMCREEIDHIPTPEEVEPPSVSEPEPQPEEPPVEEVEEPEPIETWTSLGTFALTAYCSCETCCGYWATIRPQDENGNPIVYTASGAVAEAGITIAVDPDIIPYGTTVKINDHLYIAQDTGGAIDGNRIDVYHDNHQEARKFGRQQAEVFVLKTS